MQKSRLLHRLPPIAALVAITGCATLFPAPIRLGDSEADVISKWGRPSARYQIGQTTILAYPHGELNQRTLMVRIEPSKGATYAEQVLTDEKFASIRVGQTIRDEILHTFGPPYETSYLPLKDYEVWTYAYSEANTWDSLMHIHFDRAGTVQMMLRTLDPRRSGDWFGP